MSFDMRIHDFFNDYRNIFWLEFEKVGVKAPFYEYYYAEDELYLIRDNITECVWFIEAKSPKEAFEKLQERFDSMKNDIPVEYE